MEIVIPDQQQRFTIYGSHNCQFCVKAVKVLDEHGVTEYQYHNIDQLYGRDNRIEVFNYFKKIKIIPETVKTIPMVFHYGQFIGGFTELSSLLENSKLETIDDF